jgi:hypothetical protein
MKEVVMPTNDQWRHNRRLVNDAMSPRFLSNIASQQVYNQALNLVELWRQKMRLSKGHAFNLRADLSLCTADSIWATTFGEDIAACRVQSDYLRSLDSIELLEDEDALAQFPAKPNPDAYAAWKAIGESGAIPMNSPLGRYHHVSSAKQDEKATNKVLYSGSPSNSSLTYAEPSRLRTISSKTRSRRPGQKPKLIMPVNPMQSIPSLISSSIAKSHWPRKKAGCQSMIRNSSTTSSPVS